MQVLRECNDRLARGEDGESVLHFLRGKYNTIQSLRTRTNQVRNQYCGPMDERGKDVLRHMKQLALNEREATMVDECASTYGKAWWCETGNEALDEYVASHRKLLLPQNVRDVHITSDEYAIVKKNRVACLARRHENAPSINGDEILDHCKLTLSKSDDVGLYELTLCLLAVSGRRTTELLNGKSSFEKVHTYGCAFSGQLKTKRSKVYNIPLLVPYDLFERGWLQLRKMQTNVKATNKLVSQTYQSGLCQYLHKHAVFKNVSRVHALRGIYAKLVFQMFECHPYTEICTVQRCLGHVKLEEALAYIALEVKCDSGCSNAEKLCDLKKIL